MKMKNPFSEITRWIKRDTTRWLELFCYFWVACCLGVLAYYRPDVVMVILFSVITFVSIGVVFFKVGMYFVSRIDSSEGSETK